jgi:hypothetical protein
MNLTIYKKMNIRMLPLIISLVVASTRTGAQTQELKQLGMIVSCIEKKFEKKLGN